MDLELKSRTAIVTGASIGIGRAIAKGLALEGVRLLAVARRKELLSQLAQEVQAAGSGTVIPMVLDIVGEDAAKKLAAGAEASRVRDLAFEERCKVFRQVGALEEQQGEASVSAALAVIALPAAVVFLVGNQNFLSPAIRQV